MDKLPFSYRLAKYLVAKANRAAQDDPDQEDRFHDVLELFIRYWNGVGDPIGALLLHNRQWHSHKRRAKYHSLLEAYGDQETVPIEDAVIIDGSMQDNVLCHQIIKLLEGNESVSERDRFIFQAVVLGASFSELAADLGITRQRVEQLYYRTIKTITV